MMIVDNRQCFIILLIIPLYVFVFINYVDVEPSLTVAYNHLIRAIDLRDDLREQHINSTNRITLNQSNSKTRQGSLFCLILTTPDGILERGKLAVETWGHKCDDYRLVTRLKSPLNGEIQNLKLLEPPDLVNDTYRLLTRKVLATLKYVNANHRDFDWYLKADDDAFFFVDNLKTFLSDKNSSLPVTYGYDYKMIVRGGYHSGGAGYVLSRESVHRIGNLLEKDMSACPDSGIEDTDVAACLRDLNIYPNKSLDEQGRERFHPDNIETSFNGNYPPGADQYAANPLRIVNSFE